MTTQTTPAAGERIVIDGRECVFVAGKNVFDEPTWRIEGLRPNLPVVQMPALLTHSGHWRELGNIGAATLIDWPTREAAESFARSVAAQPSPPAPAPAAPFLSVCSRHQRPDPSCPSCVPAPAASPVPAGESLADFLKRGAEEMERETAHLPRPIAGVYVSQEGRAIEITLDTSKSDYSDWIKGEGADIGLHRDQETSKVTGARLPLYAKTLVIGGTVLPTMRFNLETGEIIPPVPTPAAAPLPEGRKELPDAPGFWERDETIRVGSVVLTYVYLDYGARLSYLRTIDGRFVSCGWVDTLPRNDWHPAAQHPAGGAEREETKPASVELRFPCEVCFTNSWEPVPAADPGAQTLADGTGHVRCLCCWLTARLSAAEQRASQLSNRLESVAGALADAGTVPAAREDGNYGESVRMLVAERDEAQAACAAYRALLVNESHWQEFRAEFRGDNASGENVVKLQAWLAENKAEDVGRKFLDQLAAAQERVGVLMGACEAVRAFVGRAWTNSPIGSANEQGLYAALIELDKGLKAAPSAPPAAAAEVGRGEQTQEDRT